MVGTSPQFAEHVAKNILRRPAEISIEQTTLPVWRGVEDVTRRYPLILIHHWGTVATSIHQMLRSRADLCVSTEHRESDEGNGFGLHSFDELLEQQLGRYAAGLRIALIGPERIIAQAAASARRVGAVDDEVFAYATDTSVPGGAPDKVIFCGHCHVRFRAVAAVGDLLDCPNCAASVGVHYHFSRTNAAYLGMPVGDTAR